MFEHARTMASLRIVDAVDGMTDATLADINMGCCMLASDGRADLTIQPAFKWEGRSFVRLSHGVFWVAVEIRALEGPRTQVHVLVNECVPDRLRRMIADREIRLVYHLPAFWRIAVAVLDLAVQAEPVERKD